MQGTGASALGSPGGGLGYGTDGLKAGAAIGKSLAVKFDIYGNSHEGRDSTASTPTSAPPTDARTTSRPAGRPP